jgi:putative ABC transport system permease protein
VALSADGSGDGLGVSSDPGSGDQSWVKVVQGTYPKAPGEIAVTERTAERSGMPIGRTFTGWTYANEDNAKPVPHQLRVTAVVSVRNDSGHAAYTSDADMTPLAGSRSNLEEYERFDIIAAPGTSPAELVPAITAALHAKPGDFDVLEAGAVREQEASDFGKQAAALFGVIGMFVAIAVVAAGLVSASTFRIVFAQRMRQLALLRAVGADRGSLVRALAAEGALTGIVAGLAGILVALGVGFAAPPIAHLFGLDVQSAGLSISTLIAAVLVLLEAVVITVVAVLSPAWRASRVSPLEALRSAATTAGGRTIGVFRGIAGALLALGAAGSAVLILSNLPGHNPKDYNPLPMLMAIVLSGTLAYAALMALGPVLLRPMLAVVGWPLRRLGPTGRLAVGGVGGAPKRAAAVAVVVALGVTLTAGVLVGSSSMQVLVARDIAMSAPADLELVTQEGGSAAPARGGLTDAKVAALQSRTELKNVTPYRRIEVSSDGVKGYTAVDLDVTKLPALSKVDTSSGRFGKLSPGEAIVSAFPAGQQGLTTGSRMTVTGPTGKTVDLTVVGTMPDSAPLHAEVLTSTTDLTALGAARVPSGVLADAAVAGEHGRTAAIAALRSSAADGQLNVLADERDDIQKGMTAVLAIALGLIGLTVLIAVVGVGTTTALSVVERTRESGLLRAVGLSKNGLRAMLTTEAGLYGLIGAVMGVVLGVPYAWLSVLSLGVDAPVTLPAGQLVLVMLLLAGLTALAGALPARRAARVSPVAALAADE